MAAPDCPLVWVLGDGGFLMTAQEIALSVTADPPGDLRRPEQRGAPALVEVPADRDALPARTEPDLATALKDATSRTLDAQLRHEPDGSGVGE